VRALTEAEARDIYRAKYFRGLDGVTDPRLLEFLFDYAVNSGPGRAVKCLMTVLGGRALSDIVDQAALLWPAICERFDNFMRIMGNNTTLVVFSIGWANRMVPFWRGEMPAIADPHPSLPPAEADGILVRGEKGDAIKRLQRALDVTADGDFGPATERAVIAFQKAHGLIADGVAGPQTLGALGLA
jgi:lysozyme family protein